MRLRVRTRARGGIYRYRYLFVVFLQIPQLPEAGKVLTLWMGFRCRDRDRGMIEASNSEYWPSLSSRWAAACIHLGLGLG